jgi:hypothetical protein
MQRWLDNQWFGLEQRRGGCFVAETDDAINQ